MERAACQSRSASVKKPRKSFETEFSRGDVEGFLSDSSVIPGVRFGFGGGHSQAAKQMIAIVRLPMFAFLLVFIFFFASMTQGGGESRAGVASHPRADVAVRHPGAFFHRHGLHLHHPQLPAGTAMPPRKHDTFINNNNNNDKKICYKK